MTLIKRVPLAGVDLYDWIALRRVSGGGVVKLDPVWLESGRRVPGYVTDALTALCQRGLVTLTEPDPIARAAFTDAGTDRYELLCQQRHEALQISVPQHVCTCRRVGADNLDPAWTRSLGE